MSSNEHSYLPNWGMLERAEWHQCRPLNTSLLTKCILWPQLPRSTPNTCSASPVSRSWLLLLENTHNKDLNCFSDNQSSKFAHCLSSMYIYLNQAACRTPTTHPPADMAAPGRHSALCHTFPGMGPSWWYISCPSLAWQRKDHLMQCIRYQTLFWIHSVNPL